jgi:nucleolar protein 15
VGAGSSSVLDKRDSAVIYLGHIPQVFAEAEMRSFFTQFGEVRRLKLYRSKRTGRPKGYAFIEFESDDVARTVSEVMSGYFLHDRQLKSNVVPIGRVHEDLFRYRKFAGKVKGKQDSDEDESEGGDDNDEDDADEDIDAKKAKAKAALAAAAAKDSLSEVSPEKRQNMKKRIEVALKKKQSKLLALGVDFEFLSALAPHTSTLAQAKKRTSSAGSASSGKETKPTPTSTTPVKKDKTTKKVSGSIKK